MKKEVKAQASMEFLMTYGWVIVVALVALGALAYFGVFNLQLLLPEKCVIDATSGLFCEDFTADDVNDITLRIKNVRKQDINVVMIDVITGLEGVGKSVCSNLEGGSIAGESSDDFIVGTACDLQAGDKIKGTINILYERDGFRRSATGTITLYVRAAGGAEAGPDPTVLQKAEEDGLCGGLDFVFGKGYRNAGCCDYGLCCICDCGCCACNPCRDCELT